MPPGPSDTPALILGTGITALGVARCLGRAGVRASVPMPTGGPERRSRFWRATPGQEFHYGDELADWLTRLPGILDGAVLIPCADSLVRAVASLPAPLGARFPASVPPAEAVDQVTDKARFAELLVSLGVLHPRSWPIAVEPDFDAIPVSVFGAAFLKPADSQRFQARYGRKGIRVRSRTEARSEWAPVAAEGHALLLQEYVPGPPSSHVFVDGFVDRGGVIRATVVRRRLRMYPPEFGNSTWMVSIPAEEAGEAVEAVHAVLRGLDYRGIYSVELKCDQRDGRYRMIELNARPWWYVEFAAACGVNVCQMAWRDALGQEVETVTRYQTGRTLMYPSHDRHADPSHRTAGGMIRWLGQLARADQPVWSWSDPGPGLAAALGRARAAMPGAAGRSQRG